MSPKGRRIHSGCGGEIVWDTGDEDEGIPKMTHERWDSLSEEDKAKYKKEQLEWAADNRAFDEELEADIKAYEEAHTPHCPNCNSTNIRPISTSSRVISTFIFGLGSRKLGKSYECIKCKYTW